MEGTDYLLVVAFFFFFTKAENDICRRFLWPGMHSIYTKGHRAF